MPGVRAAAKSPSVGTPLGRSPLPAFHRSERTSALGQCWKACSTPTTITVVGSLPSTAKRRFRIGSTLTRARPLTRYVSFAPGTRKISDARVLHHVLDAVDPIVAAPVGDQQCVAVVLDLDEARLVTLGEQSSPWLPPVARIRNGEAAMKARPTASTWSISFRRTRSDGRA